LLYGRKISVGNLQNALVIVCGGSTATVESLNSFMG
jgi:L-serine/L-threonine ammonia-lyase